MENRFSIKNVKMVIGANFGDEGKGLMTDYFCRESVSKGEKSLVICHNGGCQRGHTVVRGDGIRHVFHHFGSGSFAGADTYLSEDFICNPMAFRKEWEELEEKGCLPKVWIHPHCRITTPFDMVLNQLVEEKRSNLRHGSCGMGIFETICRYKEMGKTILEKGESGLRQIRDEYFLNRLEKLGIVMDEEWKRIVFQDGLMIHYLEDLHFMFQKVKFAEISVFDRYDTLIFEGGQGLLLDQDNREYFPHLTPSNTGLKNPEKLLKQWLIWNYSSKTKEYPERICEEDILQVEVCYVTRPYLTRHGAGRLDSECSKEEINADMKDLTNVPNPYQGTMRYGKININRLKERILQDFGYHKYWQRSLALTHTNETEGYFVTEGAEENIPEFLQSFHQVYHSDKEGINSAIKRMYSPNN